MRKSITLRKLSKICNTPLISNGDEYAWVALQPEQDGANFVTLHTFKPVVEEIATDGLASLIYSKWYWSFPYKEGREQSHHMLHYTIFTHDELAFDIMGLTDAERVYYKMTDVDKFYRQALLELKHGLDDDY